MEGNRSEFGDSADSHLRDIPTVVERVSIDGLRRTKDDYAKQKHVDAILSATNFFDMVLKCVEAKMQLEKLGAFKHVGIFIDVSKGENAHPHGVEVTLEVEERKRVESSLQTSIGNNEGSMNFALRMPNLLGRGEKLSAEYSYSNRKTMDGRLSFFKPMFLNPDISWTKSVFKQSSEFPWSGYKNVERGASMQFTFPLPVLRAASHSLTLSGVWRDLRCLSRETAFAVREQAGHRMKIGLSHQLTLDTRDHPVLASDGFLIRTNVEHAGFGGDIRFDKASAELHYFQPLPLDAVLQLTLSGGSLRSLSPVSPIPDRFFLGGPMSLRGFNMCAIAPKSEGAYVGANGFWLLNAHIYTPLPFFRKSTGLSSLFRTHWFINAGSLFQPPQGGWTSGNWRNWAREGLASPRLAAGGGILFLLGGVARLELNYCWPIWLEGGDSAVHGLQFGIGISSL